MATFNSCGPPAHSAGLAQTAVNRPTSAKGTQSGTPGGPPNQALGHKSIPTDEEQRQERRGRNHRVLPPISERSLAGHENSANYTAIACCRDCAVRYAVVWPCDFFKHLADQQQISLFRLPCEGTDSEFPIRPKWRSPGCSLGGGCSANPFP